MPNCIRNGLWIAPIFLLSGCWQKIEYTGEPIAVAKSSVQATAATDAASNPSHVPETQPDVTSTPPVTERTPVVLARVDVADAQPAPELQPSPATPIQPASPVPARKPDDDDRYAIPAKAVETTAESRFAANDTPSPTAPEQQSPPRHAGAVPASATIDVAVLKRAPNVRHAAWTLGSRLSLAALAHDRRMAANSIPTWLDEARSACKVLGTTVPELPKAAPEGDTSLASPQVMDYLLAEGQRIGRDLAKQYGPEQAALFEVALKSNLLLLLYNPGSEATSSISASIVRAAPQAKLPQQLWAPLVERIRNKASLEDVRTAVRQMHGDVSGYLASAEPVAR